MRSQLIPNQMLMVLPCVGVVAARTLPDIDFQHFARVAQLVERIVNTGAAQFRQARARTIVDLIGGEMNMLASHRLGNSAPLCGETPSAAPQARKQGFRRSMRARIRYA
jgi:hypothetical protein